MLSLWDYMMTHGHENGCDCYDLTFDVPGACMEPIPEEEDDCDRVNNWVLKNTPFVHADVKHPEWDTVGDFTRLVREHFKQFVEFSKRNKHGYIMADSDKMECLEDELYKGVCTVYTLMNGNYGDEDYADFIRIFGVSA